MLSEASVGKLGDTMGQTGRDKKLPGVWCANSVGSLGGTWAEIKKSGGRAGVERG